LALGEASVERLAAFAWTLHGWCLYIHTDGSNIHSNLFRASNWLESRIVDYLKIMAADKVWDTTDVVIVGCGPTGALLSALLGDFGINNIVLEKQPDVTDDPRGITLDEDGIRLLQGVGLYDKVYTEIGSRELLSSGLCK
jgi:hypothetical protein